MDIAEIKDISDPQGDAAALKEDLEAKTTLYISISLSFEAAEARTALGGSAQRRSRASRVVSS